MEKELKTYYIIAKVWLEIDSYSEDEAMDEAVEALENGLPTMQNYEIKNIH